MKDTRRELHAKQGKKDGLSTVLEWRWNWKERLCAVGRSKCRRPGD